MKQTMRTPTFTLPGASFIGFLWLNDSGATRKGPCRRMPPSYDTLRESKPPPDQAHQTKTATLGWPFSRERSGLHRLDSRSLHALRAARDFVADLLLFLERLVAAALDLGKMREHVFAAVVRGDEAE